MAILGKGVILWYLGRAIDAGLHFIPLLKLILANMLLAPFVDMCESKILIIIGKAG